ncbi:MAG: hypothetical protein R2867_18315 [Caldilineaceae bacterium]
MTHQLPDLYTALFNALEALDQQLDGYGLYAIRSTRKPEIYSIHRWCASGKRRSALRCTNLATRLGDGPKQAPLLLRCRNRAWG